MSARLSVLAILILGIAVAASLRAADEPATPAARQAPKKESAPKKPEAAARPLDQAALEREFAEKLTGAVFSGSYSVTGPGKDRPAEMEKYTIAKVSKLKDDYWLFSARVQYGKTDLTLPMTLQVKWAGDTPMITLTDLTIPGLGTFTSRVLIFGDRYAGTWQHDKVGGHLWGSIERAEVKNDGDEPDEKGATPREAGR